MNNFVVELPSGKILTRMENGIFLLTKGNMTRPINKDNGELLLIEVIKTQKKLLENN